MDDRLVARIVESFERDIQQKNLEMKSLRSVLDVAWASFNMAINSQLCESRPEVQATLVDARERVDAVLYKGKR